MLGKITIYYIKIYLYLYIMQQYFYYKDLQIKKKIPFIQPPMRFKTASYETKYMNTIRKLEKMRGYKIKL
jgi:hypothetical protein